MNKVMYLFIFLFTGLAAQSQSDFENRIKMIKSDIDIIVSQEKETLRLEVEAINERLEKKEITPAEAERQKKAVSEKCADRIQSRIEPLEKEINDLLKGEVSGRDERKTRLDEPDEEDMEDHEDNEWREAMEEAKSEIKGIGKGWKKSKHKKRSEHRTTTQFVFAFGLNNIISEGDLSTLDNNGIKLSNSRFYEWGWTWKTRLAKNSSLLQLKYGLSLTYNNLRPDNNQYYVKNGNQTVLADHPFTLRDEAYFRMTNLVVPVHLEFDFSKKKVREDQVIIRSQKSFRIGMGGYAGINTRTKQLLEYKNDGLVTNQTTKGDYNTSNIIYGLSGYIGYKDFSIYTKYDLNNIFSDNVIKQNNISLGVRFDFH